MSVTNNKHHHQLPLTSTTRLWVCSAREMYSRLWHTHTPTHTHTHTHTHPCEIKISICMALRKEILLVNAEHTMWLAHYAKQNCKRNEMPHLPWMFLSLAQFKTRKWYIYFSLYFAVKNSCWYFFQLLLVVKLDYAMLLSCKHQLLSSTNHHHWSAMCVCVCCVWVGGCVCVFVWACMQNLLKFVQHLQILTWFFLVWGLGMIKLSQWKRKA